MIEQILNKGEKSVIARNILESLVEWFEIEEGREKFIAECVDQIFIAAKENGMTVGFLCLQETGKDTVELAVMGVLKEYHRQGIGRKMFMMAKDIAHEKGYSFVSDTVG